MLLLHFAQTFYRMFLHLLFVDQPMMPVTSEHQVRKIRLQLVRENLVAARPVRAVRNYVSYIGGVEFRLREAVYPKSLVTAVVLTTATSFAPKAEFHTFRDVTY